ncbi:MAG TPA: AgmX/PglI C-terminal domain-containing protein [Polyangia bacterium]|nr:AgmX/PglI C-terminal domain-containing protein [Polyangia bacterium]
MAGARLEWSRSPGVLVVLFLAVCAAIALMWNMSRRPAHRAVAPVALAEPPPPEAAPPEPEPAAAVAPAPAAAAAEPAEQPEISARKQADLTRVIRDGSPGLQVCYQRALVRDASLVRGNVTVRASVRPSGHVDSVSIKAPAAFRVLSPCLKAAVSKWTFPTSPAPYETEFPLALQGER